MGSTATPLDRLDVAALRAELTGRVITPDDPDYDRSRTTPVGFEARPAVVVQPVDDVEVARVVTLARQTGLPLAVRSGGHSGAGHSVCDDGIVLDLGALRHLEIDVEARTAWAQTGLTAGEYTVAASAHGLATGFGDTTSVGIGGLTLGGGVGLLVRKHGMTIDNLLAADVVTADGQIRRVDEENHPDLFWAIRGGGGNFGVVTRLQLRLVEVDPVYGGFLVLPATRDTIAGFVAAAWDAPEELTTIADVMAAPPLPFIPAEHYGQPVVIAALCHTGPVDSGEQAIAPFRALATPIVDMVGPTRYRDLLYPEEEPHRIAGTTCFLDALDRDTAEVILDRLPSSTAIMSSVQLRVLGGAMARVPADATAFAHRERPIMVLAVSIYADPREEAEHQAWAAETAAALPGSTPGAYVNFLGAHDGHRIREAYPGSTWERLVAIKTRYDHTNLFRRNQNVPPAVDGSN